MTWNFTEICWIFCEFSENFLTCIGPLSNSSTKTSSLSPTLRVSHYNGTNNCAVLFLWNSEVMTARDELKYMTHILIADFNSVRGLQLALHALNSVVSFNFLKPTPWIFQEKEGSDTSKSARFGFLHAGNSTSTVFSAFSAAQVSQLGSKLPAFTRKLVEKSLEIRKDDKSVTDDVITTIATENNLNVESLQTALKSEEVDLFCEISSCIEMHLCSIFVF